jgi:hypothetical protein
VLKGIWIGSREKTKAIQVFLCNTKFPLTYSSKTYPPKLVGRSVSCLEAKCLNGSIRCHLSCDEQTIGFKQDNADKQRISYKKEGDGFSADAIAEDGNT